MADDLLLASDDSPTAEQWQAAVEKVLKGKDFARTLVTTTLDGIAVQPLYTADSIAAAADEAGFPGFEPLLRGATAAPRDGGQWDIRTRITHPDITTANARILADLANGATSVDVALSLGTGPGVSIRGPEDLERLLAGVVLAAAPVSLRAGAHGALVGHWFQALVAAQGLADADPSGSLGIDPIGHLAASGELPQGLESALDAAVALAVTNPERVRTFVASGAPASDAGASEAQEIGYVLAVGLAYLRALGDLPNAGAQITLEVTADVDVFATVAKIRALRHCWATVLAHSGQPVDSTQVVAVSADRWLTEVDPWVNLLRGTAATLGAVVGGADSMVLAPFDSASGLPGDLGRRMARNTQLVLQDESGIGRVLDPAGGSWYIESFTDELAAAAWSFFQRIEANGGAVAALDEIGADIAAVAQRRAAQIATRKRPITGVSEFPQLDEQRPRPEPVPEADPRPPVPLTGTPTTVTAWPRRRLAQPFEDLRANAAGATVFLANLGPMSAHTARATFAANLFAAGGIKALSDTGHRDPGAAADAFRASGADIACICSSDDVYAELAADTAAALKAAGASRVYLAGRGDYPGVDEYIHVGVDVLDVLTRAEAAR
ncbi:MAG: methylmalonyl-CoA mutase family protein [Candidatus Nanopelagicales bacterium]